MQEHEEVMSRVRTSIILSAPNDADPDEAGKRRQAALQDRAKAYGYFSFSELVRAFADNKIDIVPARRMRQKEA